MVIDGDRWGLLGIVGDCWGLMVIGEDWWRLVEIDWYRLLSPE
jgi:hypothetical protein